MALIMSYKKQNHGFLITGANIGYFLEKCK